MAFLFVTDKGRPPRRAVRFTDRNGQTRTMRIGSCTRPDGEAFCRKIGQLESRVHTGEPLGHALAAWLAELPDALYVKLADYGMVEPRGRLQAEESQTFKTFAEKYAGQARFKPKTQVAYRFAAKRFVEFAGEAVQLTEVTPNRAHDFRAWLEARKDAKGKQLRPATVNTICRNVKMIFSNAVDREIIDRNPFRKVPTTVIVNDRKRVITVDEAEAVIGAMPTPELRALFALARYAGLRVHSETSLLTWSSIDWDAASITVRSPKTERFARHRQRVVPMCDRLRAILLEAFDAAEPGSERIITISATPARYALQAAIKRAGVEEWPWLWQSLRQSLATDWRMIYPSFAVSAWLGHSVAVSDAHYGIVTPELFTRARGYAAGQVARATVGSCNVQQVTQCDELAPDSDSGESGENLRSESIEQGFGHIAGESRER